MIGSIQSAQEADGVSFQTTIMPTLMSTNTPTPAPTFKLVGTWSSSGTANNIFFQGDIAYVANGEGGLVILDVSDPINVQEMGLIELGDVQNVVVQDQIAYVTVQGGMLETTAQKDRMVIIDVTIPSTPRIMGEYTPEIGFVHRSLDSIAIEDKTVYLSFDDTLIAVDVSNPSKPALLGDFSYESNIINPGLVVSDSIVYLQTNRLHIVDFRDPQRPEEIGGFDAGWGANLVLSNELLYMLGWNSGLTILDISDPAKPIKIGAFMELVGNFELIPPGAASRQTFLDVAVSGEMAYLGYNFGLDQGTWTQVLESGIIAVNISDPSAPLLVDKLTNLDSVTSIETKADMVYVTDDTRGIFVLNKPE